MADLKPRCRIYLQLPAQRSAKLEAGLKWILENANPACVLLCHGEAPIDENDNSRLVDLIQGRGAACLVEEDAALAERLGADGVHIKPDPGVYRAARALLGESASIGANCGLSRHAAMVLAETGADYVAFGGGIDDIDQVQELIAWWAEIFVVPCVAWNIDSVDGAAQLAKLGADFIAPSADVWQDGRATDLIAAIDHAVRQARAAA